MTVTAVRVAQASDVPQLVALMAEFYAESDYPLPQEAAIRSFHALLADERLGRVWLIECDGEPAGYVVLTVSFSMEYGGLRGFVDDLFVRKRFRRRGLAAAALAEVRNACVALGVRGLFVESDPDDEGAQRVYRRSGFASSKRLLLTASLAPAVHEADISDTDQEQRGQESRRMPLLPRAMALADGSPRLMKKPRA